MALFRLNNTRFSWNSLTVSVNGIPLGEGLLSLDYAHGMERKTVYGSRRDGKPVGYTSGKYNSSASFKMLREAGFQLMAMLAIPGFGSFSSTTTPFTMTINAMEIEPGAVPIMVVLSNCVIKEVKASTAEGTDELTTEFTLQEGLLISENGLTAYSPIRSLG